MKEGERHSAPEVEIGSVVVLNDLSLSHDSFVGAVYDCDQEVKHDDGDGDLVKEENYPDYDDYQLHKTCSYVILRFYYFPVFVVRSGYF